MNKALVLGASGHIGNAIVRELLAHGWQVTATSRQERRSINLEGLDIEFRSGDPGSVAEYAQWFGDHRLVVDAATSYPVNLFDFSGEKRTPMEMASQRTHTLTAACRMTGSVFATVSSFTTLVEQRSNLLANLSQHPYFGVKRAVERAVMDAWERDVDVLIINPTLCLGPWDCKEKELTVLPNLMNAEQPVVLDHVVNVVDVREVARLLRLAFENGVWAKRLICSGHNATLSSLAQEARTRNRIVDAQQAIQGATSIAALSALFGEALYAAIGQNSPFPALALMLVQRHQALELGTEQKSLGVEPRALSETITDSLSWYHQLGYC
jgi:dihydroflavonol-4-reductase